MEEGELAFSGPDVPLHDQAARVGGEQVAAVGAEGDGPEAALMPGQGAFLARLQLPEPETAARIAGGQPATIRADATQ